MKKVWLVASLALALLVSCSNKKEQEKPEGLLSERQMIDVLTDAYLIESELNYKRTSGENVVPLQKAYYDQMFEHYGITDSIFEMNMNYYSHEMATLERIMDSVTQRFEKAQR
ncbi:MAG: DUF4296 domain-containing protein [Bacteroidales bacterium]|nr:DUF4296 domain-containing protein [Bacteroidales bacterium]